MDLNYLLQRHQISLMRADMAACASARAAHSGLVRGYERQIAAAREELGAALIAGGLVT